MAVRESISDERSSLRKRINDVDILGAERAG